MKLKKKNHILIGYIPAVIIFILIAVIVILSVADISRTSEAEGLAITENSIRRAVITCYAQEGSYPPDIDYLKENYGLKISDDYNVRYNIFASNLMPSITVTRKQVSD
ncbi:MAG: hypothetical protein HDT48_06125 [Ruminococcaceae bacterium]|nr:hypothetical protein [Oscillospiraceae bacterium]